MKQTETKRLDKLKTNLKGLISEYEQAEALLNEQLQAVIGSDPDRLESLIEQQIMQNTTLVRAEEELKKHIENIFLECWPSESAYSLTGLLEQLDTPAEELVSLRQELISQMKKNRKLQDQLTALLHFARRHNMEMFESCVGAASREAEAYDASGQKKKRSAESVAINRRA